MIGSIVPRAVELSAIPMITPAARFGAKSTPAVTPAPREISQPRLARTRGRPRIAAKSISLPAMKNNMARPKSARASVTSFGWIHPSRLGPSSIPNRISKTTSGMRATRPMAAATIPASTAATEMRSSASPSPVMNHSLSTSVGGHGHRASSTMGHISRPWIAPGG